MSIPKKLKRFCKNSTSVVASVFSRLSSQRGDKKAPELPKSSNLGLSSAISQTPKYSKDNLQHIFRIV